MRRVAFLTSGGDCQALNATMRGVAKTLYNADPDTQIIGILEGYKGLMYEKYVEMKPLDFSGILTEGGTILGSSRQPFKNMRKPDANGMDKVAAMVNTYHKLKLDCLVILGGNGTQKSANMLREEGLNVVSLPKTIDNDLPGTERTFEVYDDFLLSGDGEYRISLYAQGADGSWNDNYGFVPSGTTKTMLTADGKEFLCMKE